MLLALVAGGWLVVGPSLQPLWESGALAPLGASEGKTALLWIACFYGAGALITLLAGLSLGLLRRWRRTEVEEIPTAPEVEMVEEIRPARDVAETPAERTIVYR